MPDSLTFVHLTDLHIGNPAVKDDYLFSDTSAALADILSDIKSLIPRPRFIVVSGDLTNRGDVGSYQELKRILAEAALDMPVLFALGNHDKRDAFYRTMLCRNDNLSAPYDHSSVIDGLHIIVCDSSAPNRIGGVFEPGQSEWLEAELDKHKALSKLMVMHHAPALDVDPKLEWASLSIADTGALRRLVCGRNIVGLLCGHIHFDCVSNWYGIPVVVGMGQHAAVDFLSLHESLRMVSGASFTIGTLRPSGLTVSFVPQPADRRELWKFSVTDMEEMVRKYERQAPFDFVTAT